jgi:hypothetical protein
MNAHEIIVKLEKKYAPPSWAFFTEVKSSVGGGARRADGIAVAMWRSLGLEIHGFEVKTSRPDWVRELKNGGKSDEIFQYCHRWWIVTGEELIYKDELPPTWGHQVVDGRGLSIKVKAPKLKPIPLTTWFVAEILRRHFQSMKSPKQLELEYTRGFEAGKAQAAPVNLKYQLEKAEQLQKRLDQFEAASGVKIDEYIGAKKIGEAVKTVLECGEVRICQDLEWARRQVFELLNELDSTIKTIKGGQQHE